MNLFANSELKDIINKVENSERLTYEDGMRLFRSNDLNAIGYMADLVRCRKHGDKVYFICDQPDLAPAGEVTYTLKYVHGQDIREILSHIIKLRESQDKTAKYRSFASFPVQNENGAGTTGFDDLKVLAAARLLLDNIDHVTIHTGLGAKMAQVSLFFGVNDLDGTRWQGQTELQHDSDLCRNAMLQMINAAGRKPLERDAKYNIVRDF